MSGILFKSYYVVWKLSHNDANNSFVKFKSYYVVWKHDYYTYSGYRKYWFKSYYVVWKPLWEGEKTIGKGSLNRTM